MRATLIVYAHPDVFRVLGESMKRFSGTRRSFRDRLFAAWLVFTGRAVSLAKSGIQKEASAQRARIAPSPSLGRHCDQAPSLSHETLPRLAAQFPDLFSLRHFHFPFMPAEPAAVRNEITAGVSAALAIVDFLRAMMAHAASRRAIPWRRLGALEYVSGVGVH